MQCAEENDINGYWGLDGPETVTLYDEWGTDTFRNSDFSPFLENEGVGQVPPVCSFPNGEGNAVTVLSSRERQKRYRERQKLKRTTIQNQMNEVSAEYAAVMTENVELKQRNSALQALEAYASTMLNTITSSALHSQLSLSAASLEYLKGLHGRIVNKMLQSLMSYEDLISFWDSLKITWHRKYILSLWLRHIANLLKEWKDHPDRRNSIENYFGKHRDLFMLAGKNARKWFYACMVAEVKDAAIGIEKEFGTIMMDPELINAVKLSNKQYEALKDAWYEYVAKYAELKSRLVTNLSILGAQTDLSNFKNLQISTHQLSKQNLSLRRTLEAFKELEEEERDIRMDLVLRSVCILSPLQATYLRLLNISSSDIRTVYGVILELDWDNNEALMEAKRPSKFALECLKAII